MSDTNVERQLRIVNTEFLRQIVSLEERLTKTERTEAMLRDSEKRYRRLFQSAKDGILILDAYTGAVVDVNPFLLQLLGYSYDALCGRRIWEIGLFRDFGASRDSFKTLQDNEYIRYDDLPLQTINGQSIAVEFISNVYMVDHTKVIQCNIRDITERKRAEVALRVASDRAEWLGRFPEENPSPVMRVSGDGSVLYRNPAAAELPGWTCEIGNPAPDALLPLIRQAIAENRPTQRDVDLDRRSYSVVLTPFGVEGYTNIYGHDITVRKLAEDSLKDSKAFLTTLLNAIPIPVFYEDTERRYLGFNRAFEEFFGKTRDQLIGKRVFDICPRELARVYHAKDAELLQNQGTQIYGSQVEDACGALHDIISHKATFMDTGGRVIGLIGAILDITEHTKQVREIEHINRLYSVLSRVSQAVVRATSAEKFLEQACREIAEGGGFLLSWIGHVELITDAVVPIAFWGGISEYVTGITVYADNRPEGHGPTGACIREGHPFVHNDFLHDPLTLPWHDRAAPFGIASAAAFPIERAGRVWGALTIYSNEVDRFNGEDVKLLKKVAGDIGFALDNLDRDFRRGQAEDSLRESEEQFRTLVESAPDAIFILMEGRFAYVNDAAIRLYGATSEEELLGRDIVERIHPEYRAKVLESNRSIKEERKSIPLMEQKHMKLDGTAFYVEVNSAPIKYNTSESALIFVRDITLRKAAEQGMRDSEERLKLALAAARMGVWEWNVTTNTVIWSSECYDIFGVKSFGRKIESFTDLVHPEDRDQVWLEIKQAREKRTVYRVEFRIIQPDGNVRWLTGLGQFEYDADGQPLRLVGNTQDITDRKQAEKDQAQAEAQLRQAQKMEALGTLAGGIAHDFNNMLGIIMGFTELAKRESGEGSPVKGKLDEVLKAADRAKELVKQILAFSRRTEQQKMPLQFGIIVKEALRILRASLPSTIEIKTEVLSKAAVLADPTQLHQVLLNLCTNAAHAMQDKGGTLEVRLTDVLVKGGTVPSRAGLKPGLYVKLTVRDTGCGVDPAIIDSIFDPFFTTKKQGEGTGLGLSVVHGIVENHQGRINVESELGDGTKFTVLIPALKSGDAPEKVEAQTLLPRGQERVLVVDDEPQLAEVVQQMLKSLGYDVVSLTSGMEAVEVLCHQPLEKRFDLVITDMTMPQYTGADLASELCGFEPVIPVIIMTGFSKNMDVEKAKSLGIQGFLMKPVALEQLAKTVREVLDRRVKWIDHPGFNASPGTGEYHEEHGYKKSSGRR